MQEQHAYMAPNPSVPTLLREGSLIDSSWPREALPDTASKLF